MKSQVIESLVHEADLAERVFKKNVKIALTSNLPLARWAYEGAVETRTAFIKKVRKYGEHLLEDFEFLIDDMGKRIEGVREYLTSYFPNEKSFREVLK